MTRTTIMLPEDLKHAVVERARAGGESFASFIRHALEQAVSEGTDAREIATARRRLDPIFAGVKALRRKARPGPRDLASNHDDYLYGKRYGVGRS